MSALRDADRERAFRFVAGVVGRGHRRALDARLVAALARLFLRSARRRVGGTA